MNTPRKVHVKVEYGGRDITEAVSDSLLSMTYTDNIQEADEIRITVEDVDGNWQGPWYPKVGTQGGR